MSPVGWLPAAGPKAAVDGEDDACHETGVGTGQEGDDVRDFGRDVGHGPARRGVRAPSGLVAFNDDLAAAAMSMFRLRHDLLNTRDWHSHGVAIVAGLPFDDEVMARRCVHTVSAALGRLLPQDNTGQLVREVRYRGVSLGEGATARYSDSREGGQLHTDGPHRPDAAPDWFALMCVRQAEVGGDLVLVSTSQILRLLSKDVIAALEKPFLFDVRLRLRRHP